MGKQEEITSRMMFTMWKVYTKGKVERMSSPRRMTTSQALKYFHANAVIGIKEDVV